MNESLLYFQETIKAEFIFYFHFFIVIENIGACWRLFGGLLLMLMFGFCVVSTEYLKVCHLYCHYFLSGTA